MKTIRKAIDYCVVGIISSIIWVIFKENLSISNILLGYFLGICSFFCTEHFLIHTEHRVSWRLNPLKLLKYLMYLIVQVYTAGFTNIGKIITGKINPDVVEISTQLEDDLSICILANSISLTPGTITIDKEGQRLKVLWLDCSTKDCHKAGRIIMGNFETMLKKEATQDK